MIEIYKRTLRDEVMQKLETPQIGSWIFVVSPNAEEISFLEENFKLDKGHMMDVLDEFEVPRLEIEANDLYIFSRFPYADNGIQTIPMLFILTDEYIFTIIRSKQPLLDDFLSGKVNIYTTQKIKLLLSLLLKINSTYRYYLNFINKNIKIKQNNLVKISEKDIVEFVDWERILNDFITTLVPIHNVYNTLLTKQYFDLFKEDKDLIADLVLGINENLDICKTNIKMIVNIREAYSTIMTNTLNRAIKFLTAITILVAFPTFIASLFGMNYKLPFQNHPLAFPGILFSSIIFSALMIWIFNKKGWM